ncbi:MAG TPA: glycoside hydrolase family 172 protein [Candidatus Limnocylindrales bacterium]|jgi:hypothetical protein|nr:glycoside hydrolase family 172 protein [Candidatus Limnocylindrales bacterium]
MKLISWLIFAGGFVLSSSATEASLGFDQLYRLDQLPVLKSSVKIGSVSSYDRTGGNDDGFSGKYSFVRKDAEGLVIADLKGPGIIYRIWTPTPSDDWMEFLFDGETKPRIELKFLDLFLGKNPMFPRPLVGFGAGGYYCYVPIPFAKSCVIRMRAPKVQFYQINYAIYPPQTSIESFSANPSAATVEARGSAEELFRTAGSDISRYTAQPGSKIGATSASLHLTPNTEQPVFQSQTGGHIVGLRFYPAEAIAGKGRDLVLKISYDREAPAVLCPLGDFFGYAWGAPAMQSLLVGTAGSTNYCYMPMPFKRSVKVSIVSERAAPVDLKAEVLHTSIPQATNEGKLYAVWRRENPTQEGQPYTFVDLTGRGHLVGVVLQAQGLESGKTLFFEGDDETTIDGETVIHGTGSEDFFNGGWYDVPDRWEKRLSFPLSGCLGYAKSLGRTGGYRFLLGDAYSYRRSLHQTIEHSGEKNNIPTDYCSVTYFYSESPPEPAISLPPLKDRAARDPQEVIFPAWWQTPIYAWSFDRASLTRKKQKIDNEEVRYLSLASEGSDWFGPHFLSPVCEVPADGRYAIFIEAVKGPAQGQVQLFQNENPVAEPVDLYAENASKSGRVLLGELELKEGRNNLMFKLVGKNEKSSGLGLDLIQVICLRR